MQIRFLEIAEIELDEAIQYYNYEAVQSSGRPARNWPSRQ
jgi:hypothetical protein